MSRSTLLLLVAAIGLALCDSAAARTPPNILFIYLDDFGWKDTSYMGSDFFETPHLDKLASEGMIFTNAYAGAANCAPSRACLLSGQYSPRHRIFNVGTRPRGDARFRKLEHIPGVDVLDPKIRTWAQQIKGIGYSTASIGKWHLSDDPIPYGFDVNIGGTKSGSPPRGYYPPHPRAPGLSNAPDNEYLTDRLSDEAVNFIRKNKERPWLLYLTHFAVHTPLNAKKELVAKYRSKPKGRLHDHVEMATMIQSVDDGVGKIVAALEELKIADNTVILFSSDNGGYGPATDMAPLKGYKGTYYEGGIRVPFFVKWPGSVKAGGRTSEPITGVDVYPTLCAMAGAELPEGQPGDGRNLVPLLKGEVAALGERALFWHFPSYLQSYRGLASEQRDVLFRTRPCSVVRKGDWKLHQYFEDGSVELYNLREDIGESKNLATRESEKAAQLLAALEQWRSRTGAPVPSALNPEFDREAETRARIAK